MKKLQHVLTLTTLIVLILASIWLSSCNVAPASTVASVMVGTIDALATDDGNRAATRELVGTVTLEGGNVVLPQQLKTGRQAWRVVNEGQQAYEMVLLRLEEDVTMVDAQAWIQNPNGLPPFRNVGSVESIAPGQTAWLHLDLQPGPYVVLGRVPDPAHDLSFEALDMIHSFEVE